MNAQRQRNTAAAVAIVVLILLIILGIGLFFLFNKPAAPAPVTTAPVTTHNPAPTPETVMEQPVNTAPKVLGVHTVANKDTLWWISDKWYKDPVLWPSIYEINKTEIKDPDLIFPGQKFDIPALAGSAGNLSPDDKSLLAQGYLEAYRVYKEKGRKDAEDYKVSGDRLNKK